MISLASPILWGKTEMVLFLAFQVKKMAEYVLFLFGWGKKGNARFLFFDLSGQKEDRVLFFLFGSDLLFTAVTHRLSLPRKNRLPIYILLGSWLGCLISSMAQVLVSSNMFRLDRVDRKKLVSL
jgi:hypothetical protein